MFSKALHFNLWIVPLTAKSWKVSEFLNDCLVRTDFATGGIIELWYYWFYFFNFHYYLLWAWNNLENGDISRARSNEHTATLRTDGITTSLFGRTWGYIKLKDLKTGGRRPKTLFWYAGTMERNSFLSFMSLLPTLVWAEVTEVAQEDYRCTWCGRRSSGMGDLSSAERRSPKFPWAGSPSPMLGSGSQQYGAGTSLRWATSLHFPQHCAQLSSGAVIGKYLKT